MGKARKLKALRKSLRENTPSDIRLQGKQHVVAVGKNGQHVTRMTIRHDPQSLKGKYKKIKKQGDYGDD